MTPAEIIRQKALAILNEKDIKQKIPKGCNSKIVKLEYNERQRNFHISDQCDKPAHYDWIIVSSQICEEDAIVFVEFIDNKYSKGRVRGKNPDLETIQLELRLFFKQKDFRRKYS